MIWPWQRKADIQAKSDEAAHRVAKATGEVEVAKQEYEDTLERGKFLHDVVSVVLYHAERNDIVEKFTKIARGANGHA